MDCQDLEMMIAHKKMQQQKFALMNEFVRKSAETDGDEEKKEEPKAEEETKGEAEEAPEKTLEEAEKKAEETTAAPAKAKGPSFFARLFAGFGKSKKAPKKAPVEEKKEEAAEEKKEEVKEEAAEEVKEEKAEEVKGDN